MHKLPGLTDYVVDFGRQIATAGYRVYMPVMFGKPFPGKLGRKLNGLGLCINREFLLLGKHFERIEIPSAGPNNYGIPRKAHSVLTEDYHRLEKYNKTNTDPRKRILAFLNSRLKPKEEVRGR